MKNTFSVIHNEAQSRFEVTLQSHTAVLDYHLNGEIITFIHTVVPTELEGRGIGSQLVKAALAYARENKFQILSMCWFVDKYMQRHPEE